MSNYNTELTNGKHRFVYLDGIRGVAAFIVIFGHFRSAFYDDSKNSGLSSFFWRKFDLFFLKADFSVQLFFVLSGFVLAYNSFNRDSFLKKQWIKRYYRLVMPVFLSSILYLVFFKNGLIWFQQLSLIQTNDWISKHWTIEFGWSQFLLRFFYSFIFFSDWQFIWNVNSALWTIPVELYWSYILFAFFLIVRVIKKTWMRSIVLAGGLLILIRFVEIIGEEYAVLFLAGALLALNFEGIKRIFSKRYSRLIFFVFILGYMYVVEKEWLRESPSYPFRWGYFAAIFLIFFALISSTVQRIFSVTFIQWLGRISFALYLLHLLVVASLGAWLYVELPFLRTNSGLFLLLGIVLAVSFGIAHLFTKFVDEPLMKMFDVYYKKLPALKLNLSFPKLATKKSRSACGKQDQYL